MIQSKFNIQNGKVIFRSLIALAFFALFAYWANRILVISLIYLFVALGIIFQSILKLNYEQIIRVFGLPLDRKHWWSIFLGIALALLLAIFYRKHLGENTVLNLLNIFSITAVLIGLTEELIFRGYFYWATSSMGSIAAIFLSSLFHTFYKSALFINFASINILSIIGYTFLIGLILGFMRHKINSLWPCIAFHVCFDLLVYGDDLAPWWVW